MKVYVLTTSWRLVILFLCFSCSSPSRINNDDCGDPVELKIVSYNVASAQGSRLATIATHINSLAPDFVAVQECVYCDELLQSVKKEYKLAAEVRAGVGILYDPIQWTSTNQGILSLGENDDGWGERVLSWSRFTHIESGHCVFVYATHWCVPIRNSDDTCSSQRQIEYAQASIALIKEHSSPNAPAIFLGDFNVFDGFAQGPVVSHIKKQGFFDLLHEFDPTDNAHTFQGFDWAPPGRIDYIFSNTKAEVLDAYVDTETVPNGLGSDHYPVISTLRFPPRT